MSLGLAVVLGALLFVAVAALLEGLKRMGVNTRAIQIGGSFVLTLFVLVYVAYRVLRVIHRHP